MSEWTDRDLGMALDRQAIHDVAMRFPRALDRLDAALLGSLFHDDARVEYGAFEGSVAQFVPFMMARMRAAERSFHSISNELIVLDGDRAACEFYTTAYLCEDVEGVLTDRLIGGRYLDVWTRRDGVFLIAERRFILDWNQNQPTSAVWDEGLYAELDSRGCRGAQDPVYELWSGVEGGSLG